ncbi:indole acetimide hydrolase [Prauserella marina]|uniref:Asp-tRNAAsn/Glu-tRNAGln amidotransferase A subunit n=1 Tax=Prauserella marina TaxID=530584 RepID=A0A222VQG5_9PSEU|nr:amidase [Prauserella marina]ASR35971.1 indole acetimide hydrolase [Prauserella marina]PWV84089.1 Asp-tRNA(Asn)/Glu-tRNA(Gln) amidotransferase A subunit family amidase [Prauserella marina]SDC30588.1 Asp-tRNAAsn/Glu-tRNAGln amidotransferase A subunit [Prauserella marina]
MTSRLSTMVRRVADGEVSPSALVAETLRGIEAREADLAAWVRLDERGALAAARELDGAVRAGPLRGIPFGVKDIVDVAGLPTECGSPLREGQIADRDAEVVGMLRRAGAVPVGKTVTTEFAYFAPGPTRNPHNPAHTPGGSSSGSAAAVGAGTVPLAIGSQTAGSLTRPAAFCGAAGLVAPGLPTAGFAALAPSLDSVGLLAAAVADLTLTFTALTGTAPVVAATPPSLVVWSGTEVADVEPAMTAAVAETVRLAEERGARVTGLGLPELTLALVAAHEKVMAYEAVRALAEEARHPRQLSPQLGELLATGSRISDEEYYAARAVAHRHRPTVLGLLAEGTFILAPAAPGAAPRGLAATGSPVLSRPWQLLRLPVVTVPGCRTEDGLPLGVQLVGHPDRVPELLAAAEWVEELTRAVPAGRGER